MRNFGHNGPVDFAELGINGKNSEFHAAMGIINLKYVNAILENRKIQFERYLEWMKYLKATTIQFTADSQFNYAYYPVIFESEPALLKAVELLQAHWIYPRRYFFPTLNRLKFVTQTAMPVCDEISAKILCLPLYDSLSEEEIDFICRILLRAQNN